MANAAQICAYQNAHSALKSVRFERKQLSDFAGNYVKELYHNGFKAVKDKYLTEGKRIILNRSLGKGSKGKSNYYAILEVDSNSVEVMFTDPSDKEPSAIMECGDVLVKHSYGGCVRKLFGSYKDPREAIELAQRTLRLAARKPINDYRCFLHSHLGYINDEPLWDDGVTHDRDWLLQSMLWNCDYQAITTHNWTQNEERLGFLNDRCTAANMVLIPGWENTTTVKPGNTGTSIPVAGDSVNSPHILVYCDSIRTAMRAKYQFLSKKLKNKKGITPILCGAPGPFDVHIDYMKKLHDDDRAAIVIAHPAAAMGGINLLDPAHVKALGIRKVQWLLFEFADGVEQYNFKENTRDELSGKFADILYEQMNKEGLHASRSIMMINYYVGLLAERKGKIAIASQDDHYQPHTTSGRISDKSQGHTRFTLNGPVLEYMIRRDKKPTPAEFVHAMINRRLPGTRTPVEFKAISYTQMTPRGPELLKERVPTLRGRFVEWLKFQPKYYFKIAQKQLGFWFADPEQRGEITKERTKAIAFNQRPDQPPGSK